MADLNLMAIFARVVEAGSFAEAARRMGTSRSAVSKAVAKLEKSLGAHLLNRTTRYLSLTEIGASVAEHCARMLDEAGAGAVDMMRAIKRALDPQNILNPGKIFTL
jgi:DNA-binding transcriptional LysR family regulator